MNRLKELREEAILTVHELAERSGVSEDTITKIENGHRAARPSTIRKLAAALDIEPRELRRTREPATAGKAEAPPSPGPRSEPQGAVSVPESIEELLEREGIAAPHLTTPSEEFDALYENLTFEEALALSREVLEELRAVRKALDRIPTPPKKTPAYTKLVNLGFTLLKYGLAGAANITAKSETAAERKRANESARALREVA